MEKLINILLPFIYLVIPLVISARRKAKKAQKGTQQRRQQVQRQPMPNRTGNGSLMGKLQSMLMEMERAAKEGQKPGGVPNPSGKPTTGSINGMGSHRTQRGIPANIGVLGDQEVSTAVAHGTLGAGVMDLTNGETEEKVSGSMKPSVGKTTQIITGKDGALFDREDIVKGIILSEILQPPMAIRQRKKGLRI